MAIQRARDKTEELQARAGAIEELTAAGALEDFSDNRPSSTASSRDLPRRARSTTSLPS